MDEVGAHRPPHWPLELPLAGLAIDAHGIAQRAIDHGGGEGGVDHVPVVLRGKLHRGPREAGNVGSKRLLRRLRPYLDILELIELALVRPLAGLGPGPPDDLQPLGEQFGRFLERRAERLVFLAVVAAPGGEIDAAARQEIERRPFFGNMQRMVYRQERHGGRQPQLGGVAGELGQDGERRGVDA